jgi:hypothetical protein
MSESETDSTTSALRENIEEKGANSYYFAHANTANGPQWDGKEEPRLLSKATEADSPPVAKRVEPLTEYGWADGKKVSIYVEFDNMECVEEDSAVAEVVGETLTFSFSVAGTVHRLVIGPLNGAVESTSVVLKKDMFVVKLKKEEEGEWSSLKK